jgi:hypothetical protein
MYDLVLYVHTTLSDLPKLASTYVCTALSIKLKGQALCCASWTS